MKFEGTVGLVTGGASGLGAGVVELLVERGGEAAIIDLPGSDGSALAARHGDRVSFHAADVTRPDEVEAAVSAAAERHGRVDLLVSCAGISVGTRMIDREGAPHPLEHFRRHVEVNLIGLFDVLRHAVAAMAVNEPSPEGERGLVVNLASIAGLEGQVGQAAYAASKAGVIGLTVPLARDLARHGIRVLTICPGTMDTPMLAGLDEDMVAALAEGNVFPKRLGTPADLAALVAHCMENVFLNGEVIRLDAGLRLPPR